MLWTLYRYIVREVLKLLVVAAVVLVLLISMGAAIQAMMQGVLDAEALAKFVFYTSPTMLQFALPFAAAFAATLVFCRMTADNEVMACAASGMGYITILMPVLVLGLALMLGLYYLSNTMVPAFNQRAAGVLQKDVVRYMVAELHKGRAFRHRDWVIYADAAQERAPTDAEVREVMAQGSSLPPVRVIALRDVALSMLSRPASTGSAAGDGAAPRQVRQEGTARAANVFLFRDQGRMLATAYLSDVSYFDAQRGSVYLESTWVLPLPMDNPLRDKPHFLSGRALRVLGQQPLGYDKVRRARDNLVQALARRELLDRIHAALTAPSDERGGQVALVGAGEEELVLRAGRVSRDGDGLVLDHHADQGVRVEVWRQGQVVRRFDARQGRVTARSDELDPEPRAQIELLGARVIDARATARGTEHHSLELPGARWQTPVTDDLRALNMGELERRAFERHAADSPVGRAAMTLWKEIERLRREIIAQLNMRSASAVACLWVLALGAVLAMRLRGKAPLVVFFWSFLLALLAVIITHSGRNVLMGTPWHPLAGVVAIWTGNLVLAAATLWAYLRLAKN